jgi:hypothetical protein
VVAGTYARDQDKMDKRILDFGEQDHVVSSHSSSYTLSRLRSLGNQQLGNNMAYSKSGRWNAR